MTPRSAASIDALRRNGEMIYDDLRENSTADLIAMKEHANRDIDRIDLTALRMAQGEES